jgi:hypothetical protein
VISGDLNQFMGRHVLVLVVAVVVVVEVETPRGEETCDGAGACLISSGDKILHDSTPSTFARTFPVYSLIKVPHVCQYTSLCFPLSGVESGRCCFIIPGGGAEPARILWNCESFFDVQL